MCSLVVDGARGVELVQPGRHGGVVGSIAALVAQAPEDDAGVVLVALSHTDGTVEEGIAPVGRRCQRTSQTVRLAVGLVHDVHTNRVAQFIPARTVGVVSQSHGIDVGVLHQVQVLQHALLGHHTGAVGVVLVAVDTTYLDGVAVDKQLTVLDADVAEAYLLRHALDGFPVAVLQF